MASDYVKNCISSSSGDGISTVGSGRAVNRNIGVSSSTCGGSSTGVSVNAGVSSSSDRSSTGVGSSGLLKLARLLSRHQVLTLRDNKLGGSY